MRLRAVSSRLISPFETLVWAVLGQQISLHVAFRLKAALVRGYGLSAVVDGETYHAFPEPATLALAAPETLAALGLDDHPVESRRIARRMRTANNHVRDRFVELPLRSR